MSVITNDNIKCTEALAGLENVIDPEIGLNVVDLGLIYQLDFDEMDKKLYCTMTLTTQFCPMGESIVHAVKENLGKSFSNYDVQVALNFDRPWSHEMISTKGMNFLNE
ncbi:metal-sulfur cluster assembly factor [Flavihumibacter profundi]|uniref:metal-sulfur cluster assembly factor n=1 Tax=Flavihumibacter profundi TaxID=2716883 RepID=UPI001CC6F918|nr:metal-sulfur cluster assembly factor [Flavihumibacter profundi]MBZ5857413.1 metal-sulfur cluster assembly factor [Flavihumibacter profundi]